MDAAAPGSTWDEAAGAFARWRAGESRALDDLVRCLTPVLWHTVRAYGLGEDAARDVIQNAWLVLVRDPIQVRDPQAIAGWLLTSARRLAWRQARSREVPVEDLHPLLPEHAPSPEEATIDGLEADALWRAVAALDARCQRLLRVIAFDDRPDYAVLSSELDMPVGSIGPTRRRCLDKLRTTLEGTRR